MLTLTLLPTTSSYHLGRSLVADTCEAELLLVNTNANYLTVYVSLLCYENCNYKTFGDFRQIFFQYFWCDCKKLG